MVRASVQVGDRFTRAAGSPKVSVVTALIDKPGHLPHARLLLETGMPSGAGQTDVVLCSRWLRR
ncbi:hypothetical protein M2351_003663 [Azospirillum canadense]|nr:hypothetical protein [Azospirillum canadense]